MKHGLILYGTITEESDWSLLKNRIDYWNSLVLNDNSSFFVTVSMLFDRNLLHTDFVKTIESKIEGGFDVSLLPLDFHRISIKNFQQCITKGLKICSDAGLMYTVVSNIQLLPRSLKNFRVADKLSCLSLYNDPVSTRLLNPSFMSGKTKTLKTIWKDVPSYLEKRDPQNATFKIFANVAGQNLELMNTLSKESLDIVGRIQIHE